MPKRAHSNVFESRKKRKTSANKNSNSSHPRKRRQRSRPNSSHVQKSIGNSFDALSSVTDTNKHSNNELDQNYPFTSLRTIEDDSSNNTHMASPGFGRNRLASGFSRPQVDNRHDEYNDQRTNPSRSIDAAMGESSASPIEISDDEMEESEGGMVINIDHDSDSILSGTSDEESGEITSTPKEHSDAQQIGSDFFVIDPTPTVPVKRLLDLNVEELDDQFKYAFFHLDRDRIDLTRPVVCLTCSSEGHLTSDCRKKSSERFPPAKVDSKAQFKLWISCCVCASKEHLVGDCTEAKDVNCERWSLKDIDPDQIINLSLEKGTGRLEKEAANVGMRPPGLRIKGRAGLQRKGLPGSGSSSGEVDEPFIRQPVRRRQADITTERPQSDRYDRYNPPADRPSHRGGGQWYATDSFGRQRSRSPDDKYSYRPRDDYRNSDQSHPRDNWRPGPAHDRREPQRSRAQSPPRRNRAPTTQSRGPASNGPGPGPNIKFSLPTRKGSNSWSQNGQSGTSTPTSHGNSGKNHSRSRAPRHKKKGKTTS